MLKFLRNQKGMVILLSTFGIASVSIVALALTMQSVIAQKNSARRLWNRQQFNALINPWISQVLSDLQLAARYPEAEGLPAHPLKAANGTPCATKDAPVNGKYTLDAYLLPANQACPIAIQPTVLGQEPYYNNYPANPKTYSYPKGLLTLDYLTNNVQSGATTPIVAETDPQVTLQRLGSTAPQKYLYRWSIEFNVCDKAVTGRVVPLDLTARKNTLGVNWPTSCPAKDLRKLSYSGVVNVNSDFFQAGTGLPPVSGGVASDTCGDLTKPFQGSFDSNLVANMTTTGGAVDIAEDFTANLTQTGTSLGGTWTASTTMSGAVSGTITNKTVNNASMTWTGECTGTLTGNLTISDDGCLLTGTFTGTLTGSMTNPSGGPNIPCGAITADIEGYKQ